MKKFKDQGRQGDVFLRRVNKPIPKKAEKVDWSKEKRVILAYGEVTGHAHALSTKLAEMYRWEGDRLIEVKAGAALNHEEHETICPAPGVFQVIQQRQYTPEAIINVTD